ncbi:hypothetical protein PV703_22335 [Streptomyces sp. ME01-24h]|nr:hypothetical protein [Streptomyces sp. ME01-24h]
MSNADERDLFSDPDRTAPLTVRCPAPVLDPFRATGSASASTAPAARAVDGPKLGAIAPRPGARR